MIRKKENKNEGTVVSQHKGVTGSPQVNHIQKKGSKVESDREEKKQPKKDINNPKKNDKDKFKTEAKTNQQQWKI
jgi:hypothetical protein